MLSPDFLKLMERIQTGDNISDLQFNLEQPVQQPVIAPVAPPQVVVPVLADAAVEDLVGGTGLESFIPSMEQPTTTVEGLPITGTNPADDAAFNDSFGNTQTGDYNPNLEQAAVEEQLENIRNSSLPDSQKARDSAALLKAAGVQGGYTQEQINAAMEAAWQGYGYTDVSITGEGQDGYGNLDVYGVAVDDNGLINPQKKDEEGGGAKSAADIIADILGAVGGAGGGSGAGPSQPTESTQQPSGGSTGPTVMNDDRETWQYRQEDNTFVNTRTGEATPAGDVNDVPVEDGGIYSVRPVIDDGGNVVAEHVVDAQNNKIAEVDYPNGIPVLVGVAGPDGAFDQPNPVNTPTQQTQVRPDPGGVVTPTTTPTPGEVINPSTDTGGGNGGGAGNGGGGNGGGNGNGEGNGGGGAGTDTTTDTPDGQDNTGDDPTGDDGDGTGTGGGEGDGDGPGSGFNLDMQAIFNTPVTDSMLSEYIPKFNDVFTPRLLSRVLKR